MSVRLNARGFGLTAVLVVILVLVVVGGAGFYVWERQGNTGNSNSQTGSNTTPQPEPQADPYKGWKTYESSVGGYSIKYPATWMLNSSPADGSSGEVLLSSSDAKTESFGMWLTPMDNSSSTSSANSAFTQIPYNQGSILQTLSNGISIWEANPTLTTNGHSYPDTCTPFESVSNNSFGFKLKNGKYLDAAMSFCYSAGKSTTKDYTQQAQSSELQQASKILSSLTQK